MPIFLTAVHDSPFVTARNELDHLIAETPDLQSVVITTMAAAHETHAYFNTSVCHARGPIHVSPVQTGDWPLINSEAMPSHAYIARTTAREHTSQIVCTNPSQHTSCTSSTNSCQTTSHINSRGYDSSIKGLHLSHSPCTTTLTDKSHVTSSARQLTALAYDALVRPRNMGSPCLLWRTPHGSASRRE